MGEASVLEFILKGTSKRIAVKSAKFGGVIFPVKVDWGVGVLIVVSRL